MRFSIQEQNEKKMFFHSPAAANKVTGLHLTTIKRFSKEEEIRLIIASPITNSLKSGKKIQSKFSRLKVKISFPWKKSKQSLVLSPTKFLNQVKNDQFAKKIDWISPELFPGNESETEKIDERSWRWKFFGKR